MTKQFLELDDTTRGCHRNSEMDQCGTTTYLEKLRAQCGCIDNNLKRFFMAEEVSLEYFLEIEYHPSHPRKLFLRARKVRYLLASSSKKLYLKLKARAASVFALIPPTTFPIILLVVL